MFSSIYRFEVRQQFKGVFTWIFLVLMFVQGVYYMRHSGEYFSADKTYANAPAIMYTVLAGIGYISFILTAMLGGGAIAKDLDYRSASLLYTTGVSKPGFFWGRFFGGFSVLLGYNAVYLLGIIAYSFLPVANLGPLSLAALFRGVLLILLPNTFLLYTFCFAGAVFTRGTKSAYGIVLTAMLCMIFGVSMYEMDQRVVLVDPTAFAVLESQLKHLSPEEKNVFSPEFAGWLFYNRLIWVTVAAVALGLAYRVFEFKKFGVAREGKKKKVVETETAAASQIVFHTQPIARSAQRFSLGQDWKMTLSLSWLEFKSVTRPFGFKIFLSILLLFYVCYVAIWQQQYYSAAPTLPVTIEVTGVTMPLSFYFLMFIVINTTELLFKNQSSGFWTISDALPVPSWVGVVSKVIAMLGVGILLSAFLMLLGMLVQVSKGYYFFEPEQYFTDLFVRWIPKYFAYILLVVFFAGVTGNRYVTHGLSIVFLVIAIVLHEIDVIEQNRFNYMFSPGSGENTDMNGNGIFTLAHAWFMSYWSGLAVALLAIGLWVWQRGLPRPFFKRLRLGGSKVLAGTLMAGILLFFFAGRSIYQTVNIDNHFQTHEQERAEQALYEQTYKRYQSYPQPLVRQLTLGLDLYPADRRLQYRAQLLVQNAGDEAIDTLHLEWKDFSTLDQVTVSNGTLRLAKSDDELRHRMYILPVPIQPGDSLTLDVSGKMQYTGYTNDDPQAELTFNGTFLSSDIVPYLGYDDRRELKQNRYRVQYGLPKLSSRLPERAGAMPGSFASTQAGRIGYVLNVSTEGDQTIVAPGRLEKKWNSEGRSHYRFVSPQPELLDFHILSARYEVVNKEVNNAGRKLEIGVYYHPHHPYNVEHLGGSATEAVKFLDGILGPYPYATMQIAERPRYDEDLFAFGNVLVLPENHGWIADIRRKEDLDYLRYATARLIAAQYMRQANLSRSAGYPVITESIPGYLALLQLRDFHGEAALQKHLEKAHDTYLKGRAAEPNAEPVLLKCDEDAEYVSMQKGSYVLYRLSQMIGEKKVNAAIRSFLEMAAHSPVPVSADAFYQELRRAAGPAHQAFLHAAFEGLQVFKPEVNKSGREIASARDTH